MPDKPPRILIAGFEIGGQMQLLAETFREKGIPSMAVAFNRDDRNFKVDKFIQRKGLKGIWQQWSFLIWALPRFDVFYFFWGVSLLSIGRFHHLDLPYLRLFNKKIVVHFRGTDVVNIHYHYTENSGKTPPKRRPDQVKSIKKWTKYADHILVSTPDLLDVAPDAKLFPQVIRIKDWPKTESEFPMKNYTFRIAHAPTRRHLKGTEEIISAVEYLKKRGLPIELILIEKAPYQKMPELLSSCDIGIDQIKHGWYGKISVELMALGKPVICCIDPQFARLAGYQPPVISLNRQDDLAQIIQNAVCDPAFLRQKSAEGKHFVAQTHDVGKEADRFLALLGFKAPIA